MLFVFCIFLFRMGRGAERNKVKAALFECTDRDPFGSEQQQIAAAE